MLASHQYLVSQTPGQVQGGPALGGWSFEIVGTVARNFASGVVAKWEDGGGVGKMVG